MQRPRSRVLDVTGLLCPVPVLMIGHAMRELSLGERLEVVGDDPEMLVDVPAWCERSGNRLLELAREGRIVRARIERTDLLPIGTL